MLAIILDFELFKKDSKSYPPEFTEDKTLRRIPADRKNGTQDVSTLEGTAYFLGQRKTPTDAHLLLVSHEELQRATASALSSFPRRRDL